MTTKIERIRAELLTLPVPALPSADDCTQAAISAGETLGDMAAYWEEAMPEERRDIVWALLSLGSLIYDLEHHAIIGLIPRSAVLPVLTLGLHEQWECRDDGLWLREEFRHLHATRQSGSLSMPPYRAHRLTLAQRHEALELVRTGMSLQQVAERFSVSHWVIFRLMKRFEPTRLPQHEPKLTPTQEAEARKLLRQGKALREVGAHFGVSYMAIWRMIRRDRRTNGEQGRGNTKGG